MVELVAEWPDHVFGPANASLLVLIHQPGQRRGLVRPSRPVVQPSQPILGGVGHLHVLEAPSRYPNSLTWRMIDQYLKPVLAEVDRLRPWALAMIANINPASGFEGEQDEAANRAAVTRGGRLDRIVALCRPKVVLACGIPVKSALKSWSPSLDLRVIDADHPRHWTFSKAASLHELRRVLLTQ
jgi:hypothetical protein